MIYPNDAVFFARFLDKTLWIKIKYPYWKRKKKTDFDLVIFVIDNSSSLNRKEREKKKELRRCSISMFGKIFEYLFWNPLKTIWIEILACSQIHVEIAGPSSQTAIYRRYHLTL